MANQKEIIEEKEDLSILKELVEVYAEVASIRMKKIREGVLNTRDFLSSIYDIFQDTLQNYRQRMKKRVQEKKLKSGRITFLSHNGKTAAVLISANTGLYGEVVQSTFRKYVKDIKNENIEATIIGKLGVALFQKALPDTPYTFFEYPDYGMEDERLKKIIRHLVQYEALKIYYGKYISVVSQEPAVFSLSAGAQIDENAPDAKVEYIFEPSMEEILKFFETQIFTSVFDQAIRESQLAKLASRIVAMDKASDNIKDAIEDLEFDRMRAYHREKNRKQINSLLPVFLHQNRHKLGH